MQVVKKQTVDTIKKSIKIRTWYGVNVVAEIEIGNLHRAGFRRFILPHPPVVNWLLRQKLSSHAKCQLSALHEIGHLQALPFEILYTALLLGAFIVSDKNSSVWIVLAIVAGSFAAWEISAEIYTIKFADPGYDTFYQGISLIPRTLFWGITVILVITSWVTVLLPELK